MQEKVSNKYMLKIKYVLDTEKIEREGKYPVADVVYSAGQKFARHGLQKVAEGEFVNVPGNEDHYAQMWDTIFGLAKQDWFAPYVTEFLWMNSDRGKTEDDFVVDDLIAFFKEKEYGAFKKE